MPVRTHLGPGALTERQLEVLRLLEAGKTNYEIATELGISLEGAKYHVREIMTRLNVESREDAVRTWQREQRPVRRLARLATTLATTLAAGKAAVVAAILVATAGGCLLVSALARLDRDSTPATVPPSPDAGDSASTRATATQPVTEIKGSPTPTRVPDPNPPPGPARLPVSGLFQGEPPGATPPAVTTRHLGEPPPSEFPLLTEMHTTIWDTQTGETIDLGPGSTAVFGASSDWVAWFAGTPDATGQVRGGVVTAYNLETGERREFGPGQSALLVDATRVGVYDANDQWTFYDLATGLRSLDQSVPASAYANVTSTITVRDGPGDLVWRVTVVDTPPVDGVHTVRNFALVDPRTNTLVLQFDGLQVVPIDEHDVLVVTPPEPNPASPGNPRANLFQLDVNTGAATFVARINFGLQVENPISISPKYVLWTDGFCTDGSHFVLLDRATGGWTAVEDELASPGRRSAIVTPDGGILLERYARIDPETFEYESVLPVASGPEVNGATWSGDFRYAAPLFGGGHGGGPCGE